MEHPLITKLYSALNAHDLDVLLALMHPEVVWLNETDGEYVEGHGALREHFTRQWKLINAQMEPEEVTTDDQGRLRVDVHQIVRDLAGHQLWDDHVQHVYELEDELIRSMDVRSEIPESLDDSYSPQQVFG